MVIHLKNDNLAQDSSSFASQSTQSGQRASVGSAHQQLPPYVRSFNTGYTAQSVQYPSITGATSGLENLPPSELNRMASESRDRLNVLLGANNLDHLRCDLIRDAHNMITGCILTNTASGRQMPGPQRDAQNNAATAANLAAEIYNLLEQHQKVQNAQAHQWANNLMTPIDHFSHPPMSNATGRICHMDQNAYSNALFALGIPRLSSSCGALAMNSMLGGAVVSWPTLHNYAVRKGVLDKLAMQLRSTPLPLRSNSLIPSLAECILDSPNQQVLQQLLANHTDLGLDNDAARNLSLTLSGIQESVPSLIAQQTGEVDASGIFIITAQAYLKDAFNIDMERDWVHSSNGNVDAQVNELLPKVGDFLMYWRTLPGSSNGHLAAMARDVQGGWWDLDSKETPKYYPPDPVSPNSNLRQALAPHMNAEHGLELAYFPAGRSLPDEFAGKFRDHIQNAYRQTIDAALPIDSRQSSDTRLSARKRIRSETPAPQQSSKQRHTETNSSQPGGASLEMLRSREHTLKNHQVWNLYRKLAAVPPEIASNILASGLSDAEVSETVSGIASVSANPSANKENGGMPSLKQLEMLPRELRIQMIRHSDALQAELLKPFEARLNWSTPPDVKEACRLPNRDELILMTSALSGFANPGAVMALIQEAIHSYLPANGESEAKQVKEILDCLAAECEALPNFHFRTALFYLFQFRNFSNDAAINQPLRSDLNAKLIPYLVDGRFMNPLGPAPQRSLLALAEMNIASLPQRMKQAPLTALLRSFPRMQHTLRAHVVQSISRHLRVPTNPASATSLQHAFELSCIADSFFNPRSLNMAQKKAVMTRISTEAPGLPGNLRRPIYESLASNYAFCPKPIKQLIKMELLQALAQPTLPEDDAAAILAMMAISIWFKGWRASQGCDATDIRNLSTLMQAQSETRRSATVAAMTRLSIGVFNHAINNVVTNAEIMGFRSMLDALNAEIVALPLGQRHISLEIMASQLADYLPPFRTLVAEFLLDQITQPLDNCSKKVGLALMKKITDLEPSLQQRVNTELKPLFLTEKDRAYEKLGIDSSEINAISSQEEKGKMIKARYATLLVSFHPDKGNYQALGLTKESATTKVQEVITAYKYLQEIGDA